MKKVRKFAGVINEKTLIATVDIGKGLNYGYCRCPDGTDVKVFAFANHAIGFQKFWERVKETQHTHGLERVVVGFESSGAYAEPLIHYLRRRGVELMQVNPMHTKRLKELQGNSPLKSDEKDPKVIADILELGHALTVVIPEGAAAELRRLTHARERAMQRRTALFNQLQDLVWVIFPEFLQILKDIKTQTARFLLRNYPTPEKLQALGLEALTKEIRKRSRGKISPERAVELYQAAGTSVGIKEGQASILVEIEHVLTLLEDTDLFIEELEQAMIVQLSHIPYSSLILSIKGIGPVTVAGLIGEVGDFYKFNTISEILKLAGLDLFEISSGKHKGLRRISKRGRALLRKLLYFAALNTVRKGGIMHEYYQRCLQRGMIKNKALIAVARKLLCLIFALVRDGREYSTSDPKQVKHAA